MFKITTPRAMNETFARAFNSRKLANLLALYESDAALRTDATERTLVGEAEIGSELDSLLKLPGTMVSLNNFCIQQGDVALLRADWSLVDEHGTTIASGSSAEVVRRQADGSWLYVIDHAAGAGLPRLA